MITVPIADMIQLYYTIYHCNIIHPVLVSACRHVVAAVQLDDPVCYRLIVLIQVTSGSYLIETVDILDLCPKGGVWFSVI